MAEQLSASTYGLVIAYLIPGFVALWGVSFVSPSVAAWLASPDGVAPTVGGFLYVTLASIAMGMTLSAIRWALIDTLHHATGVRPFAADDSHLHQRLAAYQWLVENHFRYHQFYAHMLLALTFVQVIWHSTFAACFPAWSDAAIGAVQTVLFAGSRDALNRYYRRTEALLGSDERTSTMTNGGQHQPKTAESPKAPNAIRPSNTEPSNKTKADTVATKQSNKR